MLFDFSFNDNSKVVTVSTTEGEWTLSKDDLNQHSASWFINLILLRPDSEVL